MNKSFQVFSFDVRKYSVYNIKHDHINSNSSSSGGEWFHFPQRSNISINFFKFTSTKNINISIVWNGNTMDKTNISVLNKDIISVIAKYPAIGFKHTLDNGTLIKRFQISFSKEGVFHDCVDCLENEMNFPIDNRKNESSKSMPDTSSLFPESQIMNPTEIGSQVIKNLNHGGNSTNADNLAFFNSDLNLSASTNNIYEVNNSTNFTNRINQRHIYDDNTTNCFQECILTPNNLQAEYSQLITPSYNYLPLNNLQPFSNNRNLQRPLLEPENHLDDFSCLRDNKIVLNDISSKKEDSLIFNLSDENLKKLIKERLQNKEFVKFVVRLDRIIHEDA